MPPKLYLVRHAQGFHNSTQNYTLPDPLLTEKGKGQCKTLCEEFKYHDTIGLVLASPLRRTIQTAALSFGPTLARQDVPFIAVPEAQEVSDNPSDTGSPAKKIPQLVRDAFSEEDLPFDISKLNLDRVKDDWDSKVGYWAYTREAISNRAQDLRNWIFQRPEANVILVTHGAFLHFFTEDWDVDDPMTGTAYNNCELRIFDYTKESTATNAHLVETVESKKTRGANEHEHDPHVLEELRHVSSRENN